MSSIRSLAFIYYTLLAVLISLNSKIISLYSCYTKKGLVYIAIAAPSSHQLFFILNTLKQILAFFII